MQSACLGLNEQIKINNTYIEIYIVSILAAWKIFDRCEKKNDAMNKFDANQVYNPKIKKHTKQRGQRQAHITTTKCN